MKKIGPKVIYFGTILLLVKH